MNDQAIWKLRIPLAILIGLALRLPAMNGGLWFDEIWTLVDFGRMPLGELLTTYGSDNNHPLYSILARCSILLLGESPFALRLPALAFGLLAIYEIGKLGSRLLGTERGVNAAFILAIASPHIWFSSNARGYTALLYFSLLATRYLVELVDEPSRGRILKQALALALATWVHATAVTLALAQVVSLFGFVPKGRRLVVLKAVLLAGLLSLAFHASILKEMLNFFLSSKDGPKIDSTWSHPLWMLREIADRIGLPYAVAIIAVAMGLLSLLFGLKSIAAKSRVAALMFVLPALFGAVLMMALGRNLWPRFFFFEFGAAILVVLAAIKAVSGLAAESRSRHIEQALTLVLMLACLVLLGRNSLVGPKQDFVAAAEFADSLPGNRVATVGLAQMPMDKYLERNYKTIDSAAELESFLESGDVYLLNTLPIFLWDRQPDLMRLIEARGEVIRTFPGSLGGGDVVVWHLK